MDEIPSTPLTLDDFVPLKGDAFLIEVGGEDAISATLIEASSLREGQGVGQRSRQFSLVWRGPSGLVLPERICRVRHPALGTLELLLVNLGPDAQGMRYEAVFT
jgi:hypothetical protein